MSTASVHTRRMIEAARRVTAPAGWSVKWTVEMIGAFEPGDGAVPSGVAGWSDFDTFDDALENFRRLRAGRAPARIVARLVGPVAGCN